MTVRVYEIAREIGLDNRELVNKIAALGIPVRNHMSALDTADVERIKRSLEKERTMDMIEERIRPTVVRRRSVRKDVPAPAASEATPPVSAETRAPAERRPEAPSDEMHDVSSAPVIETPRAPHAPAALAVPDARELSVESPAAAPVAVAPAPATPARSTQLPLPPGVISRAPQSEQTARLPSSPSGLPRSSVIPGDLSRGVTVGGVTGPRRRELGRAALGPVGRQGAARPGMRLPPRTKRPMAPGRTGQKTEITTPSAQKRVIRIEGEVSLQVLAQRMSVKATELLMKLMQLGTLNVNINSTLDADTAGILANEFGYEVENVARSDEDLLKDARGGFQDLETDRVMRPPIVTVMGHVDHGKTSLLDRIRSSRVAAGEAGGITQHIGASRIQTPKGAVVFLDTPGHEAFTAMRARGAGITDVVVLVVAADDGVMPQTREAIAHARAAKVPVVVAVNKVDKPDARPEAIRTELASEGLQPEEWGGDVMFVDVSALTGQGIDKLLEGILLQAEILELKANPSAPAEGAVLEAYLDKGRGPVANILVRNGTLRVGDNIVAGAAWGKVRAMIDDKGTQEDEVGPATAVEVVGLSEVPAAGDTFYAVQDARVAQQIAETRKPTTTRKMGGDDDAKTTLDQLYQKLQEGDVRELKLVIKADVQGSIEALVGAFTSLSTEKVRINVIHTGVGGITANDVLLATASDAIIIGFNVRPAGNAAATAKAERVEMKLYNVIYDAVDDIKKAMTGLLAPKIVEKAVGTAEVRQVFNIPKVGAVAGCFVTDGKIVRSGHVRLVRDSVVVWDGKILALRRFKDDAREVAAGYECGISLAGYNDIKERDVIECYEKEEVAATL